MIISSSFPPSLRAFLPEKNEFYIFASILSMYSLTVKKQGKTLFERKLPVFCLIEA